MSIGKLMFVLHAHLPYVRHPEYEHFLEEIWLFEAISETYLPLLRAMDNLEADNIPFRLCISISPTLSAMLRDELLQQRYIRHLDSCLELAEKEIERTSSQPEFQKLARMYYELYSANRLDFEEKYDRNVLKGFDYHAKRGRLELITTSATHAFLPMYQSYPEAIASQIQTAVDEHVEVFGKAPKGFWVPECGYYPGLEHHLKDAGIGYFFTAAHAVIFAHEKPHYGVYKPVSCPNGVAVFGRDAASANSVWSSEEGYPGDPNYRDFYRDIGYDLPLDYIGPYIHENEIRIPTGFKYHAISGKQPDKWPYDPAAARETVAAHSENFVYKQRRLMEKLGDLMGSTPVVTSPYDAELFGHWWFEGPLWLESVIRTIHATGGEIEMVTPSQVLKDEPPQQTLQPAFSSWGNKGYSEVWLDHTNDWVYRHTHKAIERMIDLVDRYPDESSLRGRMLNHAAREVLLCMSSDWPFIMRAGTNVSYAVRRVKEHVHNFTRIYDSLSSGDISTEWLTKIEKRNNIFPNLDYRAFRRLSSEIEQSTVLKMR